MRYCSGENVRFYESYGKDFSALIAEAARFVSGLDATWYQIQTYSTEDCGYQVHLYAHF